MAEENIMFGKKALVVVAVAILIALALGVKISMAHGLSVIVASAVWGS